MFKKSFLPRFLGFLLILIFISCSSRIPKIDYSSKGNYQLDRYRYEVDLTKITDDRAMVTLDCKGLNQDEVIFHFPKTIPGTYKELDYGEMIDSIISRDENGKKLPSAKISKNTFRISNAMNLSKISYWVNDSWDHPKAMSRIWPMT